MSARIKTARATRQGDPNYGARAMPGTGYRGDPGLFGFLGKVASGITGLAGSVLPGPIGAVARGASKIFGNKRRGRGQVQGTISLAPSQQGQPFSRPQNLPARWDPKSMLPGGRPAFHCGATSSAIPPDANGNCPQGYHKNKSGYTLASGQYIAPMSACVKNRRRFNPANATATSRAISRVAGAKRMAATLGRVTIRKKCD